MFHEDILYISYCKYINLIFDQLNLDNFKGDFLNIYIFCTLRFQIFKYFNSDKYCPILTNHTSTESLFIWCNLK